MHPTARKFADQVRDSHGFEATIEEFPEGTKTADDAAAAVGCDVAQIVKSIVMRVGDETVVVLTSGANRVDEGSLGSEFGVEQGSVRSADPDEVKEATGWSIGGVPPTCHATDCPVLADPTFESFDRIWAAAGTPEAVFRLTPDDLRALSEPRFVDVFE
ncbi:YbaK/EbsC family protein [Haloferax denitrificans]|uniref:YbaK/ebsC protein n=1 Tax=Haloferax denitrificans ATCC 35960 TaxID=662478 RepID=M0JED0_9EURY|nr:YbaK/EbsC family protein [Haloferax denitrificans]EMA07341.1 ybaK/ebsC protein [Haloferax denitrificans ATCC 35960]